MVEGWKNGERHWRIGRLKLEETVTEWRTLNEERLYQSKERSGMAVESEESPIPVLFQVAFTPGFSETGPNPRAFNPPVRSKLKKKMALKIK